MTARLPQLIWLTAVWVLLWGTISAKTLLGGILVAALVTAAFPLPVIGERLRVRPIALLWLVGYLTVDLVVSGVKIIWETLRHGPRATAGIVAVPLLTDSDWIATAVSNAVSLAPGTFVLQLDHQREVCYVYHLGMRGPADAERVRRQVLGMQRRVIAALGTPGELAAVDDQLGREPGGGRR
ncbi:MAG: Na+/H+ antiporter subunit E [Pseudonocardiaceae bacterium]|nr:Na+/H+ antiporter subunit E [Pseudonocardiaceae bacterium]